MKHLKIFSDKKGMAMAIVLTLSFLVLVTVGVGAALLAGNLGGTISLSAVSKAKANAQSGLERVRGMQIIDGALFDPCSANDCVDTSAGGCGTCADTIYNSGDNRHQVKISSLTHPTGGISPSAGTVSLLATGYYKNITKNRQTTMCLHYCSVAIRNCGDNGCGGSCGTCTLPATCGGGGEAGVCGTPPCPYDVTVECNANCAAGDSCGGGRVVNVASHIVAIGGGCDRTDGNGCGGGTDTLTKAWDSAGGGDTGATDVDDGRNNATTLRDLGGGTIDSIYEAIKFCDDLTYSSFDTWYLPAQNELDALYTAYQNSWVADFAGGCYWSSTEIDTGTAYYYDFSGGGVPCDGDKTAAKYLRCLRRW